MLLKLLLPPFDRLIKDGVMRVWHKAEGDAVAYGDDLFDLHVQTTRITKIPDPNVGDFLRRVSRQLRQLQQHGPESLAGEDRGTVGRIATSFVLRVCSSDLGRLRRICVRPGQPCQLGDLMALFTTEDDERIPDDESALQGAGLFRAIANMT